MQSAQDIRVSQSPRDIGKTGRFPIVSPADSIQKSEAEVTVKVVAESGTMATIQNVKKKGEAKLNTFSQTATGPITEGLY